MRIGALHTAQCRGIRSAGANRINPYATFAGGGLLACLLWTSCAYPGTPLPPALYIPSPVTNLVAVEYGDNLLVRFTIPELTTDPLPIEELRAVDLYIGPDPNQANFDAATWAAAATHFAVDMLEPGPVEFETPATPFIGETVIIGVQLTGRTGRKSSWSNYDTLTVNPPLVAPQNVIATAVPEGVEITWQAPPGSFRILRAAGDSDQFTQLGESDQTMYLDTLTTYGTEYRYTVVAMGPDLQQSLSSATATVTPEDTFPPAVPTGLSAVPGVDTIELAWARNTDPDFRSYSVYRAVGDGPFTALATGIGAPAFSDGDVASGMRYRYAISSVDASGNESARSEEVEAVVP